MQPPTPYRTTHLARRVLADGRQKSIEQISTRTLCCAFAERVAQERERGVLVGVLSPVVLAVDDPRLVGMQLQPEPTQPGSDPPTHVPSLLLTETMHHDVIAVTLERQTREFPGHPLVERIVQKEISEQR